MSKLFFILVLFPITVTINAQDYKGRERSQPLSEKLNELYCSGLFRTTDGVILDVASDPSAKTYFNILDWLPGRVAGVQVITTSSGIRIPLVRNSIPALFIDEIPISYSLLSSINSNDIAMIKIIKTPFFGGFNGAGGAIAIYTYVVEEEDEGE